MQVYKDINMCTGCSACVSICPNNCITMVEDQKGFLYPSVNEALCTKCGLCQSRCHTFIEKQAVAVKENVYSFVNSNKDVLLTSSSGGAFYEIASNIIKKKGVVCAAVYDSDWSVKHIITDKLEDLKKMQGSKYVQSRMENCFSKIKAYLKNDTTVLFVGTPCQVLGLKTFLNKDYDNLYLIDIICHSVPSPLIFKEYLNLLETQVGKIKHINLRDKTNGWSEYGLRIEGEKEDVFLPHKGNLYIEGFLDGLYHRPSCNECPVKARTGYQSDITLGDFWGYADIYPQADISNGVSAICVHSDKGEHLVSNMKPNEEKFEDLIKKNKRYNCSVTVSLQSDRFWHLYKKYGLKKAYRIIYRKPLITKFKTFIRKII